MKCNCSRRDVYDGLCAVCLCARIDAYQPFAEIPFHSILLVSFVHLANDGWNYALIDHRLTYWLWHITKPNRTEPNHSSKLHRRQQHYNAYFHWNPFTISNFEQCIPLIFALLRYLDLDDEILNKQLNFFLPFALQNFCYRCYVPVKHFFFILTILFVNCREVWVLKRRAVLCTAKRKYWFRQNFKFVHSIKIVIQRFFEYFMILWFKDEIFFIEIIWFLWWCEIVHFLQHNSNPIVPYSYKNSFLNKQRKKIPLQFRSKFIANCK